MLLVLNTPVITTSNTIEPNSNKVGTNGGTNAASKVNLANAQLPLMAKINPAPAAKAPKKKYSIAFMVKICFLLAPIVRNKILSFIRWFLLVNTEDIKTIQPVTILKPAIN